MKLVKLSLKEFNNEIDSSSPAPGGGSVSALASSMGASLSRMVGHLTVNKKKFKKLDEEIQTTFNNLLEEFKIIKDELMLLVDQDTEAFNLIMAAFKLPKETSEEKANRKTKILEGTMAAIKVPYRVCELSLEALKQLDFILEYGNKNTLSDIGVSTLMLYAGLVGASLNVKINIPGLTDEAMISNYKTSIAAMLEEGELLKNNLLEKINNQL